MKIKSIAMLLGFLCFVYTIAQGSTVFDIGSPETGKVKIFITVEDETAKNKNFAGTLSEMLNFSLLFQTSNSKENTDFILTLEGSVESTQMVATISSANEQGFQTLHQGVRFRGISNNYLTMKAAQLGNQIISKLFGLKGSLGSPILYSLEEEGIKQIYKNVFGIPNKQEKVTYNFASNFSVAYSPNGKNVVYNSLTAKGNQITAQQISPMLLQEFNVYYDEGKASAPFWGIDGIYLTIHESEKNSDIYQFSIPNNFASLENPQLKQVKKLTSGASIETDPNVSPNGKQMAYVSDKTGSPQIYILNLGTGKSRRLSKAGGYNTSPKWSPNGQSIAFIGIRKRVSSIYRINVASGKETRVTPLNIAAESPTWSPDGSLIAFTGKKGSNNTKIYYSLVNGKDYRRLTKSGAVAVESGPSWGRSLR